MDFRKCPACQASVLEDDVDDCPFCGASMSGKPKPAGSTPKAAAKPEKKTDPTAGAPEKKKPAKGKPTAGAKKAAAEKTDDDPFEVDTSAVRKAIKLSPRPTKSRTYEIICPMCETNGFMPPSEAGKDVQCANSECIVPVFKSKRPKVEAPPEEEPKSKKGLIIGVSVIALLVVGFGVYSMMAPEKPKITGPELPPPPSCDLCPPTECDDCPKECDDCKPEMISLAEIQKQSLTKVVEAARDRGDHNKNVGTQLAAETMAVAGEIDKAKSELKRLQAAGRATGYLQLQPFAELAWTQLKQGDLDGATKSATDGLTRATNLPPTIRRSLDSVTSLAAVLVAVGKKEEAVKLIADQIKDAEGKLGMRGHASVLWRTALDSGTYDVGIEAARPYHVFMPESLRIGVVETLVAHGYPDEAWSLIDSARKVVSQDACRAAWAGRLAEMQPGSVSQTVETTLAGQEISATGKTRVWAAVASHLKTLGKDEPAQAALEKAVESAQQIAAPQSEKSLNMKVIYNSQGKPYLGLNNPSEEESSALACADVALVSTQFEQADQAVEYLEKSMAFARATTPSPLETLQLFEQCEKQEGFVKSQLQTELNIGSSNTEVRNAFIRYRRQCQRFNTMANDRLQKQVILLRALAQAGLRQQVWDYIVARAEMADAKEKELFMESTLPGLGVVLADLNLENELKEAILKSSERRIVIDIVDRGTGQSKAAFLQGDWKRSSELLRDFYKTKAMKAVRDQADVSALGLIAEVMKTQSPVETFQYLTALSDPVLRQDGFMLFAAYLAKTEAAPVIWEHMKTPAIRELDALDKASIYRGFVTGLNGPKLQ